MFTKYSSESPSRKTPMTLAFAYSSPWHCIATFFGAGVLRPASGTWGTFAAWLVYLALHDVFSIPVWIAITVATFYVGAYACAVTGDAIHVHDHSSIVIDEVFAIWIVQMAVPFTFLWQVAAFLSFRFFDIVKIQPARYFDTSPTWHNGWGVMLDDLAAALQAVLLLGVVRYCLV